METIYFTLTEPAWVSYQVEADISKEDLLSLKNGDISLEDIHSKYDCSYDNLEIVYEIEDSCYEPTYEDLVVEGSF